MKKRFTPLPFTNNPTNECLVCPDNTDNLVLDHRDKGVFWVCPPCGELERCDNRRNHDKD